MLHRQYEWDNWCRLFAGWVSWMSAYNRWNLCKWWPSFWGWYHCRKWTNKV